MHVAVQHHLLRRLFLPVGWDIPRRFTGGGARNLFDVGAHRPIHRSAGNAFASPIKSDRLQEADKRIFFLTDKRVFSHHLENQVVPSRPSVAAMILVWPASEAAPGYFEQATFRAADIHRFRLACQFRLG